MTAPPEIVAHPKPQVVAPGKSASFSVVALDTRGLSYQWRFNGNDRLGATADSLLITNAGAGDEGLYSVVLANSSGSITSAPAALWIDTDDDGLPDSWEQTYFGSLARFPSGDFDGDGSSNFEEFRNGTNPTNNTSVTFTLTILSNGGKVTVNPNKLYYTNGEAVTMTATAFPPEIFHGWSGPLTTSTNPLTLVISSNTAVFAYFQPMAITWTNTANADWHNPKNWSPNFVPLSVDDVTISSGVTITINASAECHNLNYSGGTLTGSGDLTINGQAQLPAGYWGGSGRTVIAPGATLTINNPYNLSIGRTLENAGTVLWTGSARMFVENAVITNRPGAVFEVQNSQDFYPGTGAPRFDNAGTFRKSVNTGTFTAGIPFNNSGTIEIRMGILAVNGGFTSGANALLSCTVQGASSGVGYGQLQKSGTITLDGALSLNLTNGYIPALGSSFTVVSAGSRSGAFSSFAYPTNLVTMQMSNTSASVLALVTGYNTSGPPVFATNLPPVQVFYAGRTATQPVFALGAGPQSYQWTKNGANLLDNDHISGAQSSTLVISNAVFEDSGLYQIAITNSEGFAQSTNSLVMVQAVPKFNAQGAGWTVQGTTLPPMSSNTVTLTSGLGSTGRSAFYNAPLYISNFIASFLYTDVGGGGADGITFCLQNDARGPAALGNGGGGLGYGGIGPSIALAINIYSPLTRGISWRVNGSIPTGYMPVSPVNVGSGNPVHVSVLYSNGLVRTTLVESNTANSFTTNFTANFPALVGGATAYVGFTGGDGGVASTQVVSNFTFVPLTTLEAERQGPDTLVLRWPAIIGGYTLQTRSNLITSPEIWQNLPNAPNVVGGQNRVIFQPLSENRYFRLYIHHDQ